MRSAGTGCGAVGSSAGRLSEQAAEDAAALTGLLAAAGAADETAGGQFGGLDDDEATAGEGQGQALAGAAADEAAETEGVVAFDAGGQARRPGDGGLRVGVGGLVDIEHDRRAVGGDGDAAA